MNNEGGIARLLLSEQDSSKGLLPPLDSFHPKDDLLTLSWKSSAFKRSSATPPFATLPPATGLAYTDPDGTSLTMPAATGGVPVNEKHSWLYLPETDIDRDALHLIACCYVWERAGDIEAGWELVRSLAKPQPLLQTIAEVGLVKAGVRSIALLETALNSGQLRIEDGGPCLQKLLIAALPDSPECCSPNYQN